MKFTGEIVRVQSRKYLIEVEADDRVQARRMLVTIAEVAEFDGDADMGSEASQAYEQMEERGVVAVHNRPIQVVWQELQDKEVQ